MIEELKAAIASAKDGGRKPARLLLKHGPALIAAVELAEAAKAMEDGLEGPDGFGDMNLVRDYKLAMDAYRAAKKENNHES